MLIPDSQGVAKQISIPKAFIYSLAAGILILIIASFFLSAEFFKNKVTELEVDQLRTENKELTEKFETLRWNLAEVDNRYSELVRKEITIRTAFDLPEIDMGERQLGIGGPTSPEAASMTGAEKIAYATEVEIDRLLNLSKYELDKYAEVEESMASIKTRLNHTPSIWPSKGWNSRGFGMKYDPFTGYKQMHRGTDIASRRGTPVIASADGKIKLLSTKTKLGNLIVIDHGYGFQTRYGHLSKISVKRGQRVKRGEVIGLMGSTGYSTGPHLHYEVIRNGKFLDPHKYILNNM